MKFLANENIPLEAVDALRRAGVDVAWVGQASPSARKRFRGTKLTCNAEMGPAEVREHCKLPPAGQSLLHAAVQQLHLSARAYLRVLKLARTIADLAGSAGITPAHVAEAIQYRPRGMSWSRHPAGRVQ